MDDKYSKHFLLNTETAKEYAVSYVKFFNKIEDLDCVEIGDGNINYVFKVFDKKTKKSLIIKQADVLLRSSGRPLDVHRNKIEATILGIEKKFAPKYIPEIYNYNEAMCCLCMEDISDYKNLRKELMEGKMFPHFADEISSFMVDTTLPTTDLVMNRAEKKANVKLFTNPELCDITEDLVLTEPYYNYKNQNVFMKENDSFVKENLYEDKDLHYYVGLLRDEFMNHAEGLIHGDLHSGSIFINEKGTKVIDPEFAFYGPIAYDTGNVIGNLVFSYTYKYYTDRNNTKFLNYILDTIRDITDMLYKKFDKKFDEIVTFPLYKNDKFKTHYINEIMRSTYGYAGTEIIRRTVGDSKVLEVKEVKDEKMRAALERTNVLIGKTLIKRMFDLKCGSDVTQILKDVLPL